MSANVFISFASQDRKVALTLCSALENRGFNCWISARDIQPGENFQTAIVKAIRQAKIMLLVFTANSNTSEEMTKELALASQFKVMVVPLRIEDVAPSDAFAYEFATRQWIDFFSDWELAVQQLSRRIEYAVTQPAAGAKLSAAAAPDVLDDPIKAEVKTVEPAPALKAKPAPKAKADEPASPKIAGLMSGSGAPETAAAAALDKRTPTPPAASPAAVTSATEPKKSSKSMLIIAGVLGALAVVGGIAAVVAMNGKPAADAEPEVLTVDPTPATPITTTVTGPVPESATTPAAATPTSPGVPPGALPPGTVAPGAVPPKAAAPKRYNKVDTGGSASTPNSSPSRPSAPAKSQEPTVLY